MPLYFSQLYYIGEGLAKIGGLVSDSDGSLISKMSDNSSIKYIILITPFNNKSKKHDNNKLKEPLKPLSFIF